MGSPYQSQSVSGFNSSPPADDGSTVAANKIAWATIKQKLADPLNTFCAAVNTALRSALNVSPSTTGTTYTTTTADHLRPIEVTGTTTISLGDAASMVAQTMGYEVAIVNRGVATVTVSRITGTDTLNGATKDIKLAPGQSVVCAVNSTSNGYNVTAVANGVLFDPTDPSKQARFDVSGVTAGQQRVVTVPDSNITIGDVTQTGFTTGDVKLTIKTVADTGWVLMNDGTIGDASSGGTTRANADTSALFTLLWNNTANADCAVSTGRGANAAADYAAHKTIALPKALGRALATYGTGSGLTARTMGQIVGEENHTLTVAEVPSLTTNTGGAVGGSANAAWGQSNSITATISTTGGGGSHNTMQPTLFLNVAIKL